MTPQLPNSATPMTVLELTVDSFKGMRVAHVRPTPTGLVRVSGNTGNGKSSLIDSIAVLLDKNLRKKLENPITIGAHNADVRIDLGELVIHGRWKHDSAGKDVLAGLEILGKDGRAFKTPQAVLDNLVGLFADPSVFLDMPPMDQVKTVLAVTGLDQELARLESQAETHFNARRDLGRDADRATAAERQLTNEVAGLPPPPSEGSIEELTAQLQQANEYNAWRAAAATNLETVERRGRTLAENIKRAQAQIESLNAQIRTLTAQYDTDVATKSAAAEEYMTARAQLAEHPQAFDTTPITEALRAHQEASKFAGKREMLQDTIHQAAAARALHAGADRDLEAVRGQIKDLLATASFPVAGMAYDPDKKVLTINGVPLTQCSSRERLELGAAIAMAGKPAIKVVFVRQGSLFGPEDAMRLEEIAVAAGFQVWFEVVDSNKNGPGIYVEDGEAYETQPTA